MKPAILSLTLLLVLAPAGVADGLHPERVPADARWVAHIDVSGLFSSHLFDVLAEHEGVDLDADWRDEMTEGLGLDPVEEVLAITLFGSSDEPEHGTAVIAISSKVDAALERLAAMVTRSHEQAGGMSLDKWVSPDGDPPVYSYVARRDGSEMRLLIASQVADEVAHAVAVLRGDADNLASEAGAFPVAPGEGALVYVAAGSILQALGGGLHGQANDVARMVRTLEVELGEHGNDVSLRVSARTDDSQAAQQVSVVAQGAKAFAALAAQSDPEAAGLSQLLQSLSVRADGDLVTVTFSHDLERLIELVESLDDDLGDVDVHGTIDFTLPPQKALPAHKDGKKKDDGWH